MRRRVRNKISALSVIFTVLIVILSVIFLIQCIYIITELNDDSHHYYADEGDYMHYVTYEDYYRIYQETTEDVRPDSKHTDIENEIRALGYYYQAASLCKAYTTAGDDASADRQRDRMERYQEKAGEYASETEKIDELLGI